METGLGFGRSHTELRDHDFSARKWVGCGPEIFPRTCESNLLLFGHPGMKILKSLAHIFEKRLRKI